MFLLALSFTPYTPRRTPHVPRPPSHDSRFTTHDSEFFEILKRINYIQINPIKSCIYNFIEI